MDDSVKYFMDMYPLWKRDWNLFARDAAGYRLDNQQQEILHSIQENRRTSVRSGTARGKDFVGAVASVCFLHLTVFDDNWNFYHTKVINTAPTGRQIKNIMIPEIAKFYGRLKDRRLVTGNVMADGIRFEDPLFKDWYLHGFKAASDSVESWSGIHAPNVMCIVTEASGIDQIMFESIEGILQGNSRLVLIFNPNRLSGEAYTSQASPLYKSFALNCLDAPNVVNRQRVLDGEITEEQFMAEWIPGQVDWDWVDEKVKKPGWAFKISEKEVNKAEFDFKWRGEWYRPSDLFRIKVLGEFPKESEEQLIPVSWIEAAQQRWYEHVEQGWKKQGVLKMGNDIAGMGRDNSVDCLRWNDFVDKFGVYGKTTHMEDAGRIKKILEMHRGSKAYIDTIGEGAGVQSRLEEQNVKGAVGIKFSEGAKGLKDKTEGYDFLNMRAYLYWCIRDWLNPQFDSKACLPPDDELTEELTNIEYQFNSNGKIQIESKEDIKKKLGRSPDKADALAQTFYPYAGQRNKTADLYGMFH